MAGGGRRTRAGELARVAVVTVIVPLGAGLGGLFGFRFGARTFPAFLRILGFDRMQDAPCATAYVVAVPVLLIPLAISVLTMVLGALLGGGLGAFAGTALLGHVPRRRTPSPAVPPDDPAVPVTLADLFPDRPARSRTVPRPGRTAHR